jgi:hypothetical protein
MPEPPQNPIFDARSGGSLIGKDTIARTSEANRIAALKAVLPSLLEHAKGKPRIEQFLPYLLIRSFAGDQGARPYATGHFESPDIWIAVGDPTSTPTIPPNRGDVLIPGHLTTIYAHVWNLGRAPVVGATVEFYHFRYFNLVIETFIPDESSLQLIGMAKVDLAPRTSKECHKLVKCPKGWSVPFLVTPVLQIGTLVVRISGIGDPIGNDPYRPNTNRHVAMRSLKFSAIVSPVG